jgi:radical SAM protein with 4Fe4S-binding SPASM domain
METFELAAVQLTEFPSQIKRVSLSGHGEPLCNPLLPRMVGRIKELGITAKVDIHTNASLLTPVMARELADSQIDRIIVSLQGLSTGDYKKICGTDIDFDKFCENLKILYEQKTEKTALHIKIVDTALSSAEYKDKFYNIFSSFADSVFIEKIVPMWKAKKIEQSKDNNKYGHGFGHINYCSILFYDLMVVPDGSIYPCPEIPPPLLLGNVRDTTLLKAWRSPERVSFIKRHLLDGRGGHPCCGTCFLPVNTVKVKEDIIDPYRDAILARIK